MKRCLCSLMDKVWRKFKMGLFISLNQILRGKPAHEMVEIWLSLRLKVLKEKFMIPDRI